MNIFAGSRRIAVAFSLGVFATSLFNAFGSPPRIDITLSTVNPDGPIVVEEYPGCGLEDRAESFSRNLKSGELINFTLCFAATKQLGEWLIPFDKTDAWIFGSKYSPEVDSYVQKRVKSFQISDEIESRAIEAYELERKSRVKDFIKTVAVAAVAFYALVFTIGWIARGFMGIPFGMDKKPTI